MVQTKNTTTSTTTTAHPAGVQKSKSPKKRVGLDNMRKALSESPPGVEKKAKFVKVPKPASKIIAMMEAVGEASKPDWKNLKCGELKPVKASDKEDLARALEAMAKAVRTQPLSSTRRMLKLINEGAEREMRFKKVTEHTDPAGRWPVIDMDIADKETDELVMQYAAVTDIAPQTIRTNRSLMDSLREQAEPKARRTINPQTLIEFDDGNFTLTK